PHRDVGRGDGARRAGPREDRRCGYHRDELPGLRRPDAFARGRSFMIIAIDGPAASGKGTLGKQLAAHYGLRHLDTGLIYRAVAKALIDAGQNPNDRTAAAAAAKEIALTSFDDLALMAHSIGVAASDLYAIA